MSSTVLSRPTLQVPPSSTMGMLPSRSSSTCWAVVGLGLPLRLALGAATGTPAALSSLSATGWSGMRTATLLSPALVTAGTVGFLGSSNVSGPGQNRSISLCASGVTKHSASAASGLATCTISGLSAGRPLISKILRTACASSAFAPRPYTVSVGNATTSPFCSSFAAARIAASVGKLTFVRNAYAPISRSFSA